MEKYEARKTSDHGIPVYEIYTWIDAETDAKTTVKVKKVTGFYNRLQLTRQREQLSEALSDVEGKINAMDEADKMY